MTVASPVRSLWAALAVLILAFGGWFLAPSKAPARNGAPNLAARPPGDRPAGPTPPPGERAEPKGRGFVRVRVVAANLSSGRRQSWDPGHGMRILRALQADVVLIQEFNVGRGSQAEARRFVDEVCGEGFSFYREPNAQIPNGVLSRWPIRAAGKWEDPVSPNREFVWARIDLPGRVDLWAVSLHLLTRSPGAREREGQALATFVRAHVPDSDYLVIGGDLNAKHDGEPVLRILDELVSREHVPVGPRGRPGTNAPRKRPYDRVLPDRDLEAFHVPVEVAGQAFPHGLVFDTRTFADLPAPARPDDSGAKQMQHMAVVKDFLLPAGD